MKALSRLAAIAALLGQSTPALAADETTPAPAPDAAPAETEGDPTPPDATGEKDVAEAPDQPVSASSVEAPSPAAAGGVAATATPAAIPDGETQAEEKKRKKKKRNEGEAHPDFIDGIDAQVRARVMAGWEYERRHPVGIQEVPGAQGLRAERERQSFFLRQARVRFKMRFNKVLRSNVSVELSDALDDDLFRRTEYLRNAYMDAKIHDALQLRAGHFKRPYSRLELTGVSKLPVRGRGNTNNYVVERHGWGDRAVGFMYYGRLESKVLRWYLSASVPNFRLSEGDDNEGIDLHARIEVKPIREIAIGAGGAFKNTTDRSTGTGEHADLGSFGVDTRIRLGALEVLVDFLAAQNLELAGHPMAGGVAGYATYNFDLPKKFQLQPMVFGEWSDRDMTLFGTEDTRFVFGLNLLWKRWLRIMPALELNRPLGIAGIGRLTSTGRAIDLTNTRLAEETFYVMVTAQY